MNESPYLAPIALDGSTMALFCLMAPLGHLWPALGPNTCWCSLTPLFYLMSPFQPPETPCYGHLWLLFLSNLTYHLHVEPSISILFIKISYMYRYRYNIGFIPIIGIGMTITVEPFKGCWDNPFLEYAINYI